MSSEILNLVPRDVTRIYVGKKTGRHLIPQDEINALLVRLAASHMKIVRLKGGDPFLFGRGGEEALYLARHGVTFEIVPGVTSASACSSYAGIPLTHRGLARGVQFVTGHCRADEPLDLDWPSLASEDMTLAVYMGLVNVEEIASRLIDAGRPAATPVAIIEQGTTSTQRRVLTTLGQLPAAVNRESVQAPAIIVIGRVASLANELNWFQFDEAPAVRQA